MSRANWMRRAGGVKRFHTHAIIGDNTVAHHSWGVAVLLLELIPEPPLSLVKACLYHDVFELETGDIPYTAKKLNNQLKEISDAMEAKVAAELGIDTMFNLHPWEEVTLKYCDMLDLMYFCVSQRKLGSCNVDEVFMNGLRFLKGHTHEFNEHLELVDYKQEAEDMLDECCKQFFLGDKLSE